MLNIILQNTRCGSAGMHNTVGYDSERALLSHRIRRSTSALSFLALLERLYAERRPLSGLGHNTHRNCSFPFSSAFAVRAHL